MSKTEKPQGVRSNDAEIVAQARILALTDAYNAKLQAILLPLDAATRERVLRWMKDRFGADEIGTFEEKPGE